MTCVILQPSYIPWKGYFHLIQKADVFVFYDDVQYDRHGWRNRNIIKSPQGSKWLTIPTKSTSTLNTKICDIRVCWDKPWTGSHAAILRQSYSKAPFFDDYWPVVRRWTERRPELLADFTIETTIELARELGIRKTEFVRSSTLGCTGRKTGRLVEVLKKVGADRYISGPAAKEYLEEEKLRAAGIALEWMVYDYPEYPQLHGPFDHHVSVLDLLFMTGPGAPACIWRGAAKTAG